MDGTQIALARLEPNRLRKPCSEPAPESCLQRTTTAARFDDVHVVKY
jgi:hypothetical protein